MNNSEKKIKVSNFFLVVLCAIIVIALAIGAITLGKMIYDLVMEHLFESILDNSLMKFIIWVATFYCTGGITLALSMIIPVFKDGIVNAIMAITVGVILTIIINKNLHDESFRHIVLIVDIVGIMIGAAISIGMKIISPVNEIIDNNNRLIAEWKNKKDE